MHKKSPEHLAKALTLACVRNGFIEELHCGKGAYSEAGDYSDVRVVTPPVARIVPYQRRRNEAPDERDGKQGLTLLLNLEDEDFMAALLSWGARYTQKWDKPQELTDFVLRSRNLPNCDIAAQGCGLILNGYCESSDTVSLRYGAGGARL